MSNKSGIYLTVNNQEEMMESKVFDVEAAGLTLQFEFYTFDSIQEDLKKIFGDQVKQYNMSIYKKWSQIRQDQDKDRETKFFTYIKFFIEKKTNKTYGLIGGKTNYNNPDISLHDEKENERRFGRLFMKSNKEEYEMSNMILVVHHKKADEDSMQAFFIEKKAENLYRTISQKIKNLPTSNQAVKQSVLRTQQLNLTPQESEQLSKYVSDDTYVKQQKEDIEELASMFKDMLGKPDDDMDTPFVKELESHFVSTEDFAASYSFIIEGIKKPLYVAIENGELEIHYGQEGAAG